MTSAFSASHAFLYSAESSSSRLGSSNAGSVAPRYGLSPVPSPSGAAAACAASARSATLAFSSVSASLAMNSGLPPSKMSVPRPAMLVAIVIEPLRPAWAMIPASRWCCLAFSTW